MTVQIIEPGLVARTGHYFDYSLSMAMALQRRGFDVCVQAQEQADDEVRDALFAARVPFQATLPAAMQRLPRKGPDGPAVFTAWVGQVRPWLVALAAAARPGQNDLWLFPTLQAPGLCAVASLPNPPALAGLIQTPPLAEPWRWAAARIRRARSPCRLLAMDPVVAALAAERSAGLTVAAAPIPHGHWARRQPAEQVRCVGFFGHQREERGLSALGPLVRELLARGLQVLLHDTRGGVLPPEPGLEMVPGFVDDLGALMARCDLVLCPMDTDRYRQRLSGTATSAIASGVPVVLPAGTLTAQLWRDAGSVLSYEGDSMQDLLRCVDQVRANAAHFARQAQTAAQEWQRCHGLERFIDRVLAPA